jgi:hypothetical protein
LEWQTERTSLMRLCYGKYVYLSFHFSWMRLYSITVVQKDSCMNGTGMGIHVNSKMLLLCRTTLGFGLTLYFVAGQVVWKCKLRLDCQMRKGGSRSWASILTRWERTHFSVLMWTWKNLVDSSVAQSGNFVWVEISMHLFHWLQVVCFI